MTKTKKVALSIIAAFAMAACTFATLGMASGLAASAAEAEPQPAAQGWYIVGNGAGSLKDSSWTDYVPDFMLDAAAGQEEGRTGTYTFTGLELYQGDAFKVLYADGEWLWPNDSGWGADVVAQFNNLATNADGYFVNGGLGNIQATEAGQGKYNLTLTVTETGISLSYVKTGDITPIAMEEMYVVGSLKNYPTCNWPGAIDVATKCPKMTLDGNKWTVELDLEVGDMFKVYNLVNNGYFPSGINNDCVIEEAGLYYIEYEVAAPSFIVMNEEGVIVYQ